ncbi:MAG: DUF2703 domain-containing protein [Melioribacter sp.]|nr:DUF2703 domain-containing protein [Melioribacter sp.]
MKVKLELQYFEGCLTHIKLENNLKEAVNGLEDKVEIEKVLVNDEAKARQVKFRGSPTLLVNGEDIEGIPLLESPSLSCRFYSKGIPSSQSILKKIFDCHLILDNTTI